MDAWIQKNLDTNAFVSDPDVNFHLGMMLLRKCGNVGILSTEAIVGFVKKKSARAKVQEYAVPRVQAGCPARPTPRLLKASWTTRARN